MEKYKICVLGLGYVGLPLACLFATKYPVVGFDISRSRISSIKRGIDVTNEISKLELERILVSDTDAPNGLFCTSKCSDIKGCNYFIVTVPTPIDRHRIPDLGPLLKASQTVSHALKKGDIVIYESTVYPGATEEECVCVLESHTDLKYNEDFFVGYSPERINPGDKERTVENILKITSGSTPATAQKVDQLYRSVITAGTYLASSIKVAEAAKVIENSQRDINIAFVNELSQIFHILNIDIQEVLDAASTKWNFMRLEPGLVGGHCIGTDPYYIAQKAIDYGFYPEVILSARRLNEDMGFYIANRIFHLLARKNIAVEGAGLLILGFTFKENCPDIRNTKIIDIVRYFSRYNARVQVYDPLADAGEARKEYGLDILNDLPDEKFDCAILGVAHNLFKTTDIKGLLKENGVIFDIKNFLPRNQVDGWL